MNMIASVDAATYTQRKVTRYLLGSIAVVFVLFPFVPRIISSDLQPWYFLALAFFLLVNFNFKQNRDLLIFFFLSLLIIIYRQRLQYDFYDSLRAFPVYLTPPFMIYFLRKWEISLSNKIKYINVSLYIYFFVAVAQVQGLDVLGMNSEIRSAVGRGVRSLSPEPSMFGFLATLLFAARLGLGKVSLLTVAVYLGCIILSASAAAIITSIPLMLYLSLRYVARFLFLGVLLFFASPYFYGALIESMPSRLLNLIDNVGLSLITSDASINERIGHIVFIFGNAHHYFIGGLGAWGDEYLGFLWGNPFFFYGSGVNNILTGLGAVFFDAGFLGLVWICCLLWACGVTPNHVLSRTSLLGVAVLSVAIQSVSFAIPLLTLAIYCIFSTTDISDHITPGGRAIK